MSKDDSSCTVESGGFVKLDELYKIDFQAETAGSCLVRYTTPPLGTCQNSIYQIPNPQIRVLGSTGIDDPAQLGNTGTIIPNNGTTIQNYSTAGPVNTGSAAPTWLATPEGTHTIISSTAATPTLCNFTPSTFAADPLVVNVLTCKPEWNNDNEEGVIEHLNPGPVHIYTDLSANNILKALSELAKEWTGAPGVPNLEFDVVNTPCGSGTDCITITEDALPAERCAQTAKNHYSTGVVRDIVITLTTTGMDDWNDWSYNGLKWALSHELGHLHGLEDHYVGESDCPLAESIMFSPLGACGLSAGDTSPKPNNLKAIKYGVYGGVLSTCGF